MKLVQFTTPEGDDHLGYLEDDRVIDLTRAYLAYCAATGCPPAGSMASVLDLLEADLLEGEFLSEVRRFVADHALGDKLEAPMERPLAPLPRPPRIIALGLNYAAHAAETGKEPPRRPIFFAKASTAVIGPEEPIVIPRGIGRVDPEVELAIVIGRPGRRISRRNAYAHIAGYTILNDVTARDMQTRDMAASRPWFLSKSLDTFAPMGPCLVLPDEIPTPVELDLRLRVNGQLRQHSNTRDLIFDLPDIIHHLSRHLTLEPGDVIATGTPSGIAPIQPGDVVEAEIQGIGLLRNPVVAGR